MQNNELLKYLQRGTAKLLESGHFANGKPFRPTQKQALEAYINFLGGTLPDTEKLKGFFEIPTGIGKTAIFAGLIDAVHAAAADDGRSLKTAIVVPTINLLDQTQNAFKNFAPHLAGQLGLYGNQQKDLSQPVTIMTYNAWVSLTEKGEIGSHNIDFLISDEAHRGTSGRRHNLSHDFDSFENGTNRIAFTATAHFDQEKSVQQTHHNQIFYKSLPDAIQSGELASYIQTQLYEIKVMPPETSDIFNDAAENDSRRLQEMKRMAWNKRAVAIFRDGQDMRTGDPLSDNQAGFFTEGIRQADQLAKMLNDDIQLAHKAAGLGMQAVAVSIHSNQTADIQKKNLEDFLAGKYLAVVGDEKFKEGFDYPALKTIIDSPHSSLVDKAQIIGRGARQWFNEKKNRDEGLTFIDTIVYIGSKDPDINESLRNAARRNAVFAHDVLGGNVILGLGAPKKVEPIKGSIESEREQIKIDDQDVEEFTTLEEIKIFLTEVSALRRENYTEITQEIKNKLRRSGIGASKFFNVIKNIPEDLKRHHLHDLLSGDLKSFRSDLLEFVLKSLAPFPNKPENFIELTSDLFEKISLEEKRTGITVGRLLHSVEEKPANLTITAFKSWLAGKTKKIPEIWLTFVMQAWNGFDDYKIEIIPLTEEILKKIADEQERTDMGAISFFKKAKNIPKDLKQSTINNLRPGRIKTIRSDHLKFIFEMYAEFPDKSNIEIVLITEDILKNLVYHRERSGIGSKSFIKITKNIPEGINAGVVNYLMSGNLQSMRTDLLAFISKTYENFPNKPDAKTVPLTEKVRINLIAHKERTGIGSISFMKKAKNIPEGLKATIIDNIFTGKSKTAREDWLEFITKTYQSFPDCSSAPGTGRQQEVMPSIDQPLLEHDLG